MQVEAPQAGEMGQACHWGILIQSIFINQPTFNFGKTITFKKYTFEPCVFLQIFNLSEPLQIIW